MAVLVQRDACVGAGQCALVAPAVFDQDDDGIVMVLDADPDGVALEVARKAARLDRWDTTSSQLLQSIVSRAIVFSHETVSLPRGGVRCVPVLLEITSTSADVAFAASAAVRQVL